MRRCRRITEILALIGVLAGCASVSKNPDDPWESFNRKTYAVNKAVDKVVVRPFAVVYQHVVPNVMKAGVGNFFDNLGEITTILNDILQGKIRQAGHDSGRFLLNSTVGLAGLVDVASKMKLERHEEDFGQTLAVWGVKKGPYMILPLFGPTTLRDGVGSMVDSRSDPILYVDPTRSRNQLWAGRLIDKRYGLLDSEKYLTDALDEYSFVRDAYMQRREYLINDGRVDEAEDCETVSNNECP